MMTVEEIKKELRKRAVIFETGGKRPENKMLESWIGKVSWKYKNECMPTDEMGNVMIPIAEIFLSGLPFCPKELAGIELITIFMSEDIWDNLIEEDLSPWFHIRAYKSLDNLEKCEYKGDMIKPFPLLPQIVENDFPMWDGGGIPPEIEDIILEMEKKKELEYFDDVFEENYNYHKIGGYPSFCQSGYWFENGYEFVLQISSDEKANFNIVDDGNFYFYYNTQKQDWKVYCDFF